MQGEKVLFSIGYNIMTVATAMNLCHLAKFLMRIAGLFPGQEHWWDQLGLLVVQLIPWSAQAAREARYASDEAEIEKTRYTFAHFELAYTTMNVRDPALQVSRVSGTRLVKDMLACTESAEAWEHFMTAPSTHQFEYMTRATTRSSDARRSASVSAHVTRRAQDFNEHIDEGEARKLSKLDEKFNMYHVSSKLGVMMVSLLLAGVAPIVVLLANPEDYEGRGPLAAKYTDLVLDVILVSLCMLFTVHVVCVEAEKDSTIGIRHARFCCALLRRSETSSQNIADKLVDLDSVEQVQSFDAFLRFTLSFLTFKGRYHAGEAASEVRRNVRAQKKNWRRLWLRRQ